MAALGGLGGRIGGMDYTDFLWIKLIALGLLAFFGNFFYTLLTGRSLGEDLSDRQAREEDSGRQG